jgi:hypothetical protein
MSRYRLRDGQCERIKELLKSLSAVREVTTLNALVDAARAARTLIGELLLTVAIQPQQPAL